MTRTLLNDDGSYQALNWKCFNHSDFALQSEKELPNGAGVEATFIQMANDPNHPLTARVGVYPKPLANDGVGATNVSVRIDNEVYDDVLLAYFPQPITIAFTVPGLEVNLAGIKTALQMALSFILPGTTTGHATTVAAANGTWLDQMSYGIAILDMSTATTPA